MANCAQPLDGSSSFPSFSFWVNVAEEANSNTRSGKSSHSSDDFPRPSRGAASLRHSFLGWLSIIGPSNHHDSAERYLVLFFYLPQKNNKQTKNMEKKTTAIIINQSIICRGMRFHGKEYGFQIRFRCIFS